MDLTPYLDQLRDDVLAAAALGSEPTKQAAALVAGAVGPSARLVLMTALSDFAAEVTAALGHTTVDVRLDGRDVRVHVGATDQDRIARDVSAVSIGDGDETPRPAAGDEGADLSRTTLRMISQIKSQAEQAASRQGISLNTYISRAVSQSLGSAGQRRTERHRGDGGSRSIVGWVQS